MTIVKPSLAIVFLAQTSPATEPDKGMVAFVLAMLLIGVAVVGVVLLVLVVLWGGRTRRITREELPGVRAPDPFETMRAEARRHTAAEQSDNAPPPNQQDFGGDDDE